LLLLWRWPLSLQSRIDMDQVPVVVANSSR
jgi:hypothetical protein